MQSSKLGRPKSQNPKDKAVKIRMDRAEIETLDDCCKKLNINRSDVIRQGIKRIFADFN